MYFFKRRLCIVSHKRISYVRSPRAGNGITKTSDATISPIVRRGRPYSGRRVLQSFAFRAVCGLAIGRRST